MVTKPVGVQPPCTLHPEGQDRRLAGSTSTATPPHRRIHELVAISAKFFKIDSKKTLVLASSAKEKCDINPTSAGPSIDMHAPGEPGDLPYAVGCPAFTRELWQVQWPSTNNFKPDVPEKYDGKTHPSEFVGDG